MPLHQPSPNAAECERRLAALVPLLDELIAEVGIALNFAELAETEIVFGGGVVERVRPRLQTAASLTSDHLCDAKRVIDRMKDVLHA